MMRLLLLSLCLALAVSAERVPTFSFTKMKADLAVGNVAEYLAAARHLGAFAVEDVPNAEQFRSAMSSLHESAPACLSESAASVRHTLLADGVKRSTSAVSSHAHGNAHPDCIQVEAVEAAFDATADLVFGLVASAHAVMPEYYVEGETRRLDEAPFLDHMHVYRRPEGHGEEFDTAFTAPLHVDNGLFLLVTPSAEHPLLVSDPAGRPLSAGHGDVVVVFGRAMSDWLDAGHAFRPAPHAVPSFAKSKHGSNTRTVFARMLVAPDNAVVNNGRKFGDMFHNKASSESAYALCTANSKDSFFADQQMACAEDQIYCWMSCLQIDPNCAADEQVCENPAGEACCTDTVTEDCLDMDGDCGWHCPVRQ